MPAIIAIITELIIRYKANIHPKIPYVAIMESTPVVGVEIRNESVAPLLAPDLLIEFANGITPHEHTGNGVPKRVALITKKTLLLPKCFVTKVSGISSCKIPANISPKIIYGAIETLSCHKESKKCVISIYLSFYVLLDYQSNTF